MNYHAKPYAVDVTKGERRGEVSKQWIARDPDERFTSLDELRAAVYSRAVRSEQLTVKNNQFEVIAPNPTSADDTHKLTVGLPNGTEVGFTHWSFSQLCSLARSPSGFLRELPSQITADALNWRLKRAREVEALKAYYNPDEMRAVTGPEYGRIFDHEVVDAVMQIAGSGRGESRWKVPGTIDWRTHTYDPETPVTKDTTTLYASDRDVFMFLVDDRNPIEVGKLSNGNPDLMFRGFYVSNSETGSASLRLAAFYLRGVCMNRNLWGVEGFQEVTMRHSRMAPDRWIHEARPALQSFSDGSSQKLIDGVQKAKEAKIAADDDEAVRWLQERSFSRTAALKMMADYEKDEDRKVRTAWDAVQAITASAREKANTSDRIEIERIAGKVLDKVS